MNEIPKKEDGRIDFHKWLSGVYTGPSEDSAFIIKFCDDMQKEGKMTDTEILEGSFKHMIQQSNFRQGYKISEINGEISNDINKLKDYKCWTSSHDIAKHAMEIAVEIFENDKADEISKAMLYGTKIRLEVLNTDTDHFKDVFKPEFLEKFKHLKTKHS